MPAEAPIQVGLIGVGRHGSRYREHLLAGDVPGLELTGLCRRDHARGRSEAAELGLTYYETPEALAAAVDGLVVVTPPASHGEAIDAALAAGIPALVEKPLAADALMARALVQRIGDAPIMVAHTLRFDVFFTALVVASRDVGGAQHVDITCGRQGLGERPGAPHTSHPALLDVGVHYFDWASLVAPGGFTRAFAAERGEDETFVLLEGPHTQLRLLIHRNVAAPLLEARVIGPEGVLVGDGRAHRLDLRVGDAEQELSLPPRGPALVPTLQAFADLIRGGPNLIPPSQGLLALECAEACLESLSHGAPVSIGERREK